MCFASINVGLKRIYEYGHPITGRPTKSETFGNYYKERGSYHFWCVGPSGEIIDPTPQQEPNPQRIVDKPVYIPWSPEKQEEVYQKEVATSNIMEIHPDDARAVLLRAANNPQALHCFINCLALEAIKHYKIVCGSMGYIVARTETQEVVVLDFGA